jgi:hypothetical protein
LPSIRMTAAPVPNETRRRFVVLNVSVSWLAASVTFAIRALPAASSRHTLTGPVGWICSRTRFGRAGARLRLRSFFSSAGAAGSGVDAAGRRASCSGSSPHWPSAYSAPTSARMPTITAIQGASTGRRGRLRRPPMLVPNGVSSCAAGRSNRAR